MAQKWYERFPDRLKAEQLIMQERFPQFVLKENDRELFWEGILIPNLGTTYQVSIVYPGNYPYQRPIFRVVEPRIRRNSPHLFADGSLCVYPKEWNYARCTAPAGVPLVAGWLLCYEVWVRTGKQW